MARPPSALREVGGSGDAGGGEAALGLAGRAELSVILERPEIPERPEVPEMPERPKKKGETAAFLFLG